MKRFILPCGVGPNYLVGAQSNCPMVDPTLFMDRGKISRVVKSKTRSVITQTEHILQYATSHIDWRNDEIIYSNNYILKILIIIS